MKKIDYDNLNILKNDILFFLEHITIPNNPCIILDLDNTIIDSNGYFIKPIYEICLKCLNLNITIFIITGRVLNNQNLENTYNQISKLYYFVKQIYFRLPYLQNFYEYKKKARYDIFLKGYTCIATIGDNIWDIGLFGGNGFIIPTI